MVLHWVVLVTPGANVLLISQLAASGHKRAALYASLGICMVALIWATLAILGLNAVFAALPQLRLAIQVVGGLYLIYVAIRLWRSGQAADVNGLRALAAWPAFRLGFLTNITNPKSALFFGSVFATALPPAPSAMVLVTATALVVFNALVWHLFLALAFSHAKVQARYARFRIALNRLAACIVGAIGVRLLFSTVAEMKRGS